MKKIWIAIVKLCGWKFDLPEDMASRPELQRCVIVVLPHTSSLDFLVGAAVLFTITDHLHLFMKKEFFNFFTRGILGRLGVIPVDRGNRHNGLVQKAVDTFAAEQDCVFCMTPEATRKRVKRVKRGFYDIAMQAGVPIVFGYMDYEKKIGGVGPALYPTGDYAADTAVMREFYRQYPTKHPEKYDPDWV